MLKTTGNCVFIHISATNFAHDDAIGSHVVTPICMSMKSFLATLFLALVTTSSVARNNNTSLIDEPSQAAHSFTDKAPADLRIESAFSPDADSEALVLKVINTAQQNLRLAAYSFTSPTIVKALLAAKKRGVEVFVVVDQKGNNGKSNIAALNLLVSAGIPTRTIATYAIHHDKYIIADERHVQNGSFNYSRAAAKSNSENVVVIWNDANLAASFLKHWQSRWEQGVDFQLSY